MKIFTLILLFFILGTVAHADTTAVLRPIADGGEDGASWTNTAGAACSGADCSLEVKESSGASCTNSDGDTSYIQSNVNSARQTFTVGLSNIPDNSTITQIDITVCARKSTTGAANSFQTRRCANATCVSSGTNLTTGTAYAESTQSHTGLTITKTTSTGIEIGAEVTGSVTNNVRLSQISVVITYTPPPPPPPPTPSPTPTPSGGGGGGVSPTTAVFSGQAYPGSKIEILRKSIQDEIYRNIPAEFSRISNDGAFYITYTGLIGGDYFFALRVEDKDGRKTGIISFNVDLLGQDKLIGENIFVPPTTDFEKAVVALGKEVKLFGYAASERKIEIEIDPVRSGTSNGAGAILKGETKSDISGFWSFETSTAPLRIGDHYARARQTDVGGKVSEFSVSRTFRVSLLASPKADLNNDDKVSITDLSIFLFRWGSEDKALRTKIDMNDDGKINISDFSIFLKAIQL